MEAKKDEAGIPVWVIILIIVVVFIGIIIFILTLGNVDIADKVSLPAEFKESRNEALERHNRLKELIESQIQLKRKLERRFKLIYLGVRMLFVVAWGGLLFLAYFFGLVKNLEDYLNFSEATLLVFFAFNFLAFGSLTNLDNTINSVKTRLENWVYGKHVTLESEIERNQLELFETEKALNNENRTLNPYQNVDTNP